MVGFGGRSDDTAGWSTRSSPSSPAAGGRPPAGRPDRRRRRSAARPTFDEAHHAHPGPAGRDGHPDGRARRPSRSPGRHAGRPPTRTRTRASASSASAPPYHVQRVGRARRASRTASPSSARSRRQSVTGLGQDLQPRRASRNYADAAHRRAATPTRTQRPARRRSAPCKVGAAGRPRPASATCFCCSPSINIFVGLFNLIPLLPFDGGHVAIATYEAIRSRNGPAATAPTSRKMMPVSYAVLALVRGRVLDIGNLYLDVVRLLDRPACSSAARPARSTSARWPSAATRRSPCSR